MANRKFSEVFKQKPISLATVKKSSDKENSISFNPLLSHMIPRSATPQPLQPSGRCSQRRAVFAFLYIADCFENRVPDFNSSASNYMIGSIKVNAILIKKKNVGSEFVYGRIYIILHFHLNSAEIYRVKNLCSVSVRIFWP